MLLATAEVVIILQYRNTLNQYIIQLKLTQFYVSITSKFGSVTQLLCLTLWDPMDCSTPGLPVQNKQAKNYLKPANILLKIKRNSLE